MLMLFIVMHRNHRIHVIKLAYLGLDIVSYGLLIIRVRGLHLILLYISHRVKRTYRFDFSIWLVAVKSMRNSLLLRQAVINQIWIWILVLQDVHVAIVELALILNWQIFVIRRVIILFGKLAYRIIDWIINTMLLNNIAFREKLDILGFLLLINFTLLFLNSVNNSCILGILQGV